MTGWPATDSRRQTSLRGKALREFLRGSQVALRRAWFPGLIGISNLNGGTMKSSESHLTSVPPTPGEVAVASVQWERRGLLGRLVRVDDPAATVEEEQFRPAA